MNVFEKSPQLVVALDNLNKNQLPEIISILEKHNVEWVKVGLESYLAFGNEFIEFLKLKKFKVFLDLKLHDIPNTVAKALKQVVDLGVHMTTVHALGGEDMLKGAFSICRDANIKLAVVTTLTSLSDDTSKKIFTKDRLHLCFDLAQMALDLGYQFFVSSVYDMSFVKSKNPKFNDCFFITPGIRDKNKDEIHDQYSIATIEEAIKFGSNYLVIGRPILAPKKGTVEQAIINTLKRIKQ
jgi:orotidine-5'-phosphate decarboxylase